MPFHFQRFKIPGVILVKPDVFGDQRGYFMETYKWSEFSEAGIPEHFVQDNHSKSAKGVLRGLHFQKNPKAQGKLVRCLKGRIFDVAVDIRKGSPTYSQWEGVEISEENNLMFYVPSGFAHGFVVVSDHAEICYKCTAEYSREYDRGIIWNDPDIGIQWPINNPILSAKDEKLPLLGDADNDFTY
jgi:dTDP-4-dehydrorhamnose 3,5-epimerase